MLIRSLLALALLTVAAHAADFERTLQVGNAPDLYVSNGSGHIHVFAGSDSQIHVRAHVYSNWSVLGDTGDTQDRIRRIDSNPPIHQNGNEVRIGDVPAEDRGLFNNITIDYEISVPRSVALNLRSGSGEIRVDEVGRFLKADSGSGSVRALGIVGSANLHTGSGDIELRERAEGEVRAVTGSGSIRINGLNGKLTAQTGSGDIEASGSILADSHLQSGSGSIALTPARTPTTLWMLRPAQARSEWPERKSLTITTSRKKYVAEGQLFKPTPDREVSRLIRSKAFGGPNRPERSILYR